jgi:Protein of unknown function (DUF2934)
MAEPRKRTSERQAPVSAGDQKAVARKQPARGSRKRDRQIFPSDIAERAYAISQGESAGSPEENWLRAEQELLASASR